MRSEEKPNKMIPSPKLFKKKPICSQAEWFFPLRSSLVCRKKCSIIFLRCCFIKKQYYLINIHNMQHEILLKNLLKISLPISWLVTKAVIGPVSHKLVVPFAMLLDNNLPLTYKVRWNFHFYPSPFSFGCYKYGCSELVGKGRSMHAFRAIC